MAVRTCSAQRRPVRRQGQLQRQAPNPSDVHKMIRRRARQAGIETQIGCHSFRATGITNYLQNGGRLEVAQQMAGHESSRTTASITGVGTRFP
jgi:integrase/recombinase XerD